MKARTGPHALGRSIHSMAERACLPWRSSILRVLTRPLGSQCEQVRTIRHVVDAVQRSVSTRFAGHVHESRVVRVDVDEPHVVAVTSHWLQHPVTGPLTAAERLRRDVPGILVWNTSVRNIHLRSGRHFNEDQALSNARAHTTNSHPTDCGNTLLQPVRPTYWVCGQQTSASPRAASPPRSVRNICARSCCQISGRCGCCTLDTCAMDHAQCEIMSRPPILPAIASIDCVPSENNMVVK